MEGQVRFKIRIRSKSDQSSVADSVERTVDRLSSELACLTALGAVSDEEEHALRSCFAEIRRSLARVRDQRDDSVLGRSQRATDLRACSGMARALAADMDLAYRRLTHAA